MRLTLVGLILLLTGCSSQFDGEWLEQAPYGTPSGERKMAIKFEAPSTVRYGLYNAAASAVDSQSVQISSYILYDRARRAQFGSMIARIEGDHLFANVGDAQRRFVKIKGPSIFPPAVKLPELTRADVKNVFAALSVCPVIG